MYLLDVDTLQLKEFISDSTTPRYAILSHTWYEAHEELSFQDVMEGNLDDAAKRRGRQKIDGCCAKARRENFRYVWIDTCCIDQSSSAQLEEAIISMFRWYQRASICYVYLTDVPSEDDPTLPQSAFSRSRWFTRGWTLQELLAPTELRFYTYSWEQIALKQELAVTIERITGIPHSIVRDSTNMSRCTSVAQRMSWAAKRKTTRDEDHAYCLVSLFGVHMIKKYGEGARDAFIRLQKAILETTGDDSLFSWGLGLDNTLPATPPPRPSSGASQPDNQDIWASSPSDFRHCSKIVPRASLVSSNPAIAPNGLSISVAFTEYHGTHYGLLNCQPRDSPGLVVGIPLLPSTDDQNFFKAHGRVPKLLATTSARTSRTINVLNTRPSRTGAEPSWAYLDVKHSQSGLVRVDQFPADDWTGSSAKICLTVDAQLPASGTKWRIARFQPPSQVTDKLLLVVLEVNLLLGTGNETAYCHLMTVSPSTPLGVVYGHLPDMRSSAFGHDSVSFGNCTIAATVTKASSTSFAVELHRSYNAQAGVAVNTDVEIAHIQRRQGVVLRMLQHDDLLQRAQDTTRVSVEKSNANNLVLLELDEVQQKMHDLEVHRHTLQEKLETLLSEQQEAGRAATRASKALAVLENGIAADMNEINEAEGDGRDWIARAVATHHGDVVLAPRRNGLGVNGATDPMTLQNGNWIIPVPSPGMPTWDSVWPITQLVGYEDSRGQASDTGPAVPPIRCPESHGAVIRAFYHGRLSEAHFLLENCVFSGSLSAAAQGWLLMHAASVKNDRVVRALTKRNAPSEVRDAKQYTALMHAVSNCDLTMTRHLLDRGANINADREYPSGFRMLPHAIKRSRDDIATVLIQNDTDLNDYPRAASTPLTAAVKELNHEMVRLLLDSGATPVLADRDGNLPIAHAVQMRSHELVKLLLSRGSPASASYIAEGQCKASIAGLAASYTNTDILKCLLAEIPDYAGADKMLPWQPSKSPIIYAAETGNVDALDMLVAANYRVDVKWEDGSTALIFAAENDHVGMVKHLLTKYKSESLHKRAFDYAAVTGHLPAIEVLVSCGARPRVNAFTDTPIRLAQKHGHFDVAEYLRLISRGAR